MARYPSKKWYNKGLRAAQRGATDAYESFHAQKGKPGDTQTSGKRIEAQESFVKGFHDGKHATRNPRALPSTWTAARVRRLPNGRIHVEVTGRPTGRRNPSGGWKPSVAWNVYLGKKKIDTVFQNDDGSTAADIKRSLVNHDGYDPSIRVSKQRKRRR